MRAFEGEKRRNVLDVEELEARTTADVDRRTEIREGLPDADPKERRFVLEHLRTGACIFANSALSLKRAHNLTHKSVTLNRIKPTKLMRQNRNCVSICYAKLSSESYPLHGIARNSHLQTDMQTAAPISAFTVTSVMHGA